jgi:SAF domain
MMGLMAVSVEPRERDRAGPASPPASRSTSARWRDPRLVVGAALVALSALAGARLAGGADETAAVWVARHDVPAGQPLTARDVAARQVRFAGQGQADRYLSADDALPAGAVLARPVGAGELVPRQALDRAAPDPLTEVPVSVATDGVPVTVGVGSVVDVWVTPDPSTAVGAPGSGASRVPRSVRVFDDVAVVAAPSTGTSLGPAATRQVIVGVTGAQAADLPTALAALTGGAVVLTVQR